MNRNAAIQLFALLAIVVGALVCYFPPKEHGAELWALITMYLSYAVRDLFGHTAAPPENPTPASGQTPPFRNPAP